jgi:D-alanyl-D-alanine carboxypeptidase
MTLPSVKRPLVLTLCMLAASLAVAAPATASATKRADAALDRAIAKLVEPRQGPPGAISVVQRGSARKVHRAGVANLRTGAKLDPNDHMRLASTAKAFSGAVALSLVETGELALDDTIGTLLAGQGLPDGWSEVTLAQALRHTSGLPEYLSSDLFREEFVADPRRRFDSRRLWAYVAEEPLRFPPGSAYEYSNTDNIIVALMAEAATGVSYEQLLATRVYEPLGIRETSLPGGFKVPRPFIHGYAVDPPQAPEDVSQAFSASGAWASGGVLSTPSDLSSFARGYVGAKLFSRAVQADQMQWVDGDSDPPGPGVNSAGLAVFRYETSCGTVFGHTGNFPGFTQFFASSLNGRRSVTFSVTEQLSNLQKPEIMQRMRRAQELAVCAALAVRG